MTKKRKSPVPATEKWGKKVITLKKAETTPKQEAKKPPTKEETTKVEKSGNILNPRNVEADYKTHSAYHRRVRL